MSLEPESAAETPTTKLTTVGSPSSLSIEEFSYPLDRKGVSTNEIMKYYTPRSVVYIGIIASAFSSV